MELPICNETKKCCMQTKRGETFYCIALDSTYTDGKCPFFKVNPNDKPRKIK